MFPSLADIQVLIADAKDLKVSASMRDAATILNKLADTVDLFLDPAQPKSAVAVSDEEIDGMCSDLSGCVEHCMTMRMGPTDGKTMDPASIIMIVNAVLTALKAFRDWRQNR